jgi:hypothetical protein
MCYGQQSMPLLQFNANCDTISTSFVYVLDYLNPLAEVSQTGSLFTGSISFIAAFRTEYCQQGPPSISHLLRVFGNKEASVPADKVFALVGMTKPYSDGCLTQLVNYSEKTQDDTLLNLAHILFDNNEALDVLDLAGIGWERNDDSSLPSWAVDWTVVRSGMPVLSKLGLPAVRYHATKGMPSRMRRGESRLDMVVRGKSLDRIRSISPIQSTEPTSASPVYMQIKKLLFYLDSTMELARKEVQDPYLGQPLEEAVWRTLIGDKTISVRPAPDYFGRILRSTMQLLLESIGGAQSYEPREAGRAFVGKLHDHWGARGAEEIQQDSQDMANISLLFDTKESDQTHGFCTTESGYIGMVPQWSRVGDIICLIYGLDVPYVVREVGGRFRLVGNSYIHGLMDGEGLNLPQEDEDFVLF